MQCKRRNDREIMGRMQHRAVKGRFSLIIAQPVSKHCVHLRRISSNILHNYSVI